MRSVLTHLVDHKWSFFASTAWFVYDYVLTFSAEVRCIWRRPLSLPSSIFVAIRYSSLLYQAISILCALSSVSLTVTGLSGVLYDDLRITWDDPLSYYPSFAEATAQ